MFVLVKPATYEAEIKKSRFIANAASVSTPAGALAFLERIRQIRATHHCWAYKIGPEYRFSDDGEPGGTAGRPILNAIENQAVDGVMVVVIRYYGGVKLGAGGLARAYGGCAVKCLQGATINRIVQMTEIQLRVGFDHIGTLYATMDRFGAEKLEEEFTDIGLEVRLKVNRTDCQVLVTALTDASSGGIHMLSGC